MTAASVCVVLGILLYLLMRGPGLRPMPMVVAIIFGLILGSTSAGPPVHGALDSFGTWVWANGRDL
ncbi:MAG: hypothetical protein J2P22_03060 [Nocardioides sp.]|nr:hypothetical protein [Nocardioides sp.]